MDYQMVAFPMTLTDL